MPIEVRRQSWQTKGIYLSDVCLAIKLIPLKVQTKSTLEEAREDLRTLVMLIFQLACDHDLLRPIAAFLPLKPTDPPDWWDEREIRDWYADQDWHRGDFSLFIEDDSDNSVQIDEILFSKSPLINIEDIQLRTDKKIIDQVKGHFKTSSSNEMIEVNKALEKLIDKLELSGEKVCYEYDFDFQKMLSDWLDDITDISSATYSEKQHDD